MMTRLEALLGQYEAGLWCNKPIDKWHGFTVKDMMESGYYSNVMTWFNELTDKEILEINKKGIR